MDVMATVMDIMGTAMDIMATAIIGTRNHTESNLNTTVTTVIGMTEGCIDLTADIMTPTGTEAGFRFN